MRNALRLSVSVALAGLLVGCGSGGGPSSSTAPTTPTARAFVAVVSFSVTGSLNETEYHYSVLLSLQNTGSAAANIASIVFRLTLPNGQSGTATVAAADLFGSATLAPGASTLRPTLTLSDTTDHGFASSIGVTVTYSDAAGSNTVTQAADVPPLPPSPPPTPTFTLSGSTVEGSSGVSGARVEVTTGQDAGAAVLTDSSGAFSFSVLNPGTITLLVSKSGYANLQQNVTLAGNISGLRLSLTKTSNPPPPPPSLCAPATAACGAATARCNDGTLSCSQNRSGTCSSHKGVQCFICPGQLCNGLTAPQWLFSPLPLAYTPAEPFSRRQ